MKVTEIILILILAIYAAIEGIKWNRINWIKRFFVTIAIITAVIIAYNAISQLYEDDFLMKVNASYGDIEDVQDATLPAIGLGMLNDAPRIVLNVTGTFGWEGKNLNIPNLLKVYIKNDRLYINQIIYDSAGVPALGIFENTWKVYSNEFEYNYDNHAIELVTNADHSVFFHLELRNGVAHIEGSLYTQKDDVNRIKGIKGIKIFTVPYGGGVTPLPLTGGGQDFNTIIAPLFKYPKEKFVGTRVHY